MKTVYPRKEKEQKFKGGVLQYLFFGHIILFHTVLPGMHLRGSILPETGKY
jgi:hypothetical protein